VTPTSFLELLNLYKQIVEEKRKELKQQIDRLEKGLEKLNQANKEVDEMKIVLEEMQPELKKAEIETEKTMQTLKVEKEEASKT
jgi:dynein heavy chain